MAEPSKETLDKLRAEAETAAEEKVKQANAKLIEAQAQADTAAAETEKLRKQLEMIDKDTQAFSFYWEEAQHKFNAMLGAMQAVSNKDAEKAERLKNAVQAMLTKWEERL